MKNQLDETHLDVIKYKFIHLLGISLLNSNFNPQGKTSIKYSLKTEEAMLIQINVLLFGYFKMEY